MKKSKLLIPLFTIAGTTAMVAPIMTSCTQGEVEETHFTKTAGDKAKTVDNTVIAGQLSFEFTTTETFKEDEAKLIEPVAVVTTANSYISLVRCWKQSFENKTMKVLLSFTVNPEAYEYKKDEAGKKLANEKVEFDIKIHNGTWTQTIKDFSIEAIRNNK